MKKGCLFLLAFWGALALLWNERLQSSPLADQQPWTGILLGLSATIVVGNIFGLIIAVRQMRASSKTPGEWSDGDLICVSGQIRATKDAVISPLSGKYCSMVEYEMNRFTSDENSNSIPDFRGMLMAPSTIQTMRGAVKVVGFPLFGPDKMRLVSDDQVYKCAAEYLAKTQFKDHPKNPLKMLKDLTDVLKDNDGDVKADFKQQNASVESLESFGSDGADHSYDDEGDEFDEDENEDERGDSSTPAEPPSDRVARIAAGLQNEGYSFKEVAVENGTDVTVFGSYRAPIQAVDISGGLSNLNHQFHFGQVSVVVGKQLRSSIFALVFWGAVFAGSHYWVLEKLGYDVKKILGI